MSDLQPQCGDCRHFPRCEWLVDRRKSDVPCDWKPSRFVRREQTWQEQADRIEELESENAELRWERDLLKRDQSEGLEQIAELERWKGKIEAIANTGTVQNWLRLPDDEKAKWFAIHVEESNRRKDLERRLAQCQTDVAFYKCCAMSGEVPFPGAEPSVKARIDGDIDAAIAADPEQEGK